MLRTLWSPLAKRAARAYVAGPALDDALVACRLAARRGVSSTIGFWNGDHQSPEEVAAAYLATLGGLGDMLDCYLSVKALPLGFSRDLSSAIVIRARRGNVRVHFDSLGLETVEPTFAMIEDGLTLHGRMGCTLPGRWNRSLRDADRAVELGLDVRVVKGQFPSRDEMDPRSGFMAVVDRLAGRARFVAVATHDASLAQTALDHLISAGTPCEAELLYGLPSRHALRVARAQQVSARLYVPYGKAWLPYRLSHARHNPGLLWWVTRDLVRGGGIGMRGLSGQRG